MKSTEIFGYCPTKNMKYVAKLKFDTIKTKPFETTINQKENVTFSCEYVDRGNACEYYREDCPLYQTYNFCINDNGTDDYLELLKNKHLPN